MAGSLVVAERMHCSDARFDLLTRQLGLFQHRRHLRPRVVGPEQENHIGNRGIEFGGARIELHFCLGDDDG